MNEIADDLHALNTRLTLVERDIAVIASMRKWIMTGVVAILLQASGMLYTYGQLTQKVEQIASIDLQRDVSTTLTVLGDHGTELESVRTEQARVRERMDILADRITVFHP